MFIIFLPITKAFLSHHLFSLPSSVTFHTACNFTAPFTWAPTTPFCYFHCKFLIRMNTVSESICLSTHHSSDISHLNPPFLRYLRTSTGPEKFRAAGSARLWRAHQLWIWGEEKGMSASGQQMQLSCFKNFWRAFYPFGEFRTYHKIMECHKQPSSLPRKEINPYLSFPTTPREWYQHTAEISQPQLRKQLTLHSPQLPPWPQPAPPEFLLLLCSSHGHALVSCTAHWNSGKQS